MATRPDDDLTIAGTTTATTPSSSSGTSATRFVPGAIVASRYRLVALLGKGGMGEVYRADDLTLDHPVALKFLPEGVGADGARLAQFHNELRIARQVSHKNVCRLYDLGEADGRKFLTMEYVDGEDLASLLRRIGRLPQDKAVEIARQLCAGLAAAHECGVLHRDLKPANVMIDGNGHVRITDFGLAVAEGQTGVAHAGTPQYMAPEQLAGQPASVRSDIYALGLILFEIFTGKRAYEAKTLNELVALHQSSAIASPSSVVRDLDPAVERVILRCLERDPAQRPGSAIGVAAALPGGDPLAAALAAGETPSPEMVAAAGQTAALAPGLGLAIVAFVCLGLLAYAAMADRQLLVAHIQLDKPFDALVDRARDIAGRLGYPGRGGDAAYGMDQNGDYLSWVARTDSQPTRWDALGRTAAPTLRVWYRSSPRPLVTLSNDWAPSLDDPPPVITNMLSVVVDMHGRLVEFLAVPPQVDNAGDPPAHTDWSRLFEAAGLDMAGFHPAAPQWVPRVFAGERAAWDGPLPDDSKTQIRVEAAGYRGRPVFFAIVGPWTRPTRMGEERRAATSRGVAMLITASVFLLLLSVVVLARRNLRVGRGDRRGATRISLAMLVVWMAAWLFSGRHLFDAQLDLNEFMTHLSLWLLNVGLTWLMYVALEPHVRRCYPDILISWTRLLGAETRDARVGRDILVGVGAGVSVALLVLVFRALVPIFGAPPPMPKSVNAQFLIGARTSAGAILRMVPNALQNAMLITFVFAVFVAVSKRVWVAAAVATAVFGVFVLGDISDSLVVGSIFAVVWTGALVATLARFGLLSLAIAFYVNQLLANAPVTLDPSKLYAGTSVWVLAVIAGLAAFGFYASRAGEPLFGNLLPRD